MAVELRCSVDLVRHVSGNPFLFQGQKIEMAAKHACPPTV